MRRRFVFVVALIGLIANPPVSSAQQYKLVSSLQVATGSTATPIRHLVVIFDENISFDHYFATYPNAVNPLGEPSFTAIPRHTRRKWPDAGFTYAQSRCGSPFPP